MGWNKRVNNMLIFIVPPGKSLSVWIFPNPQKHEYDELVEYILILNTVYISESSSVYLKFPYSGGPRVK